MNILSSVYEEIMESPVGSQKPEQGGVLFSSDGGQTIDKFVYDSKGSCSGVTYSPDVDFINSQIKYYSNLGYYFVGCIHSHPKGFTSISYGKRGGDRASGYTASDEEAIIKLVNAMKGTKRLYFPIVQSAFYGMFSMRIFCGEKNRDGSVSIFEDCVCVTEDTYPLSVRREVKKYIPIEQFTHTTAVLIGAGNAPDLAMQLTRFGLCKFILIDSTRYVLADLTTSGTYTDIGGYKAEYVARQIASINPIAQVKIIRQHIDMSVDYEKFRLWLENIDRKRSLVIFCNGKMDNFERTKEFCSAYRIALMRTQLDPKSDGLITTDFYDYWVQANAESMVYRSYAPQHLDAGQLVDVELFGRASTFFTKKANKASREAEMLTWNKPTVDKFASLYSRKEISHKMVVVIGCGGSMSYIENLARSGIGHLVLIDGDKYGQSNVQTQMAYLNDNGRYKVDVAKERIRQIDSAVDVTAVKKMLDEEMTDEEFIGYVGAWVDSPNDVLIAACTDNFTAQARCAKLALKYGFPYIQAGIFPSGHVLELIFFHPEVSTVCPRCMLSSRYKANLEAKVKPMPAKSDGTSIFITEQLNSLKGFLSLALLLYHSPAADKRYSEFLDDNFWITPKRKTDRNYMFFTMDSKLAAHTGKKHYVAFDKWGQRMGSNYQLGVCLFRKRKPRKKCPDCGGTGGPLIHVKGTIADTRDGLYSKEDKV